MAVVVAALEKGLSEIGPNWELVAKVVQLWRVLQGRTRYQVLYAPCKPPNANQDWAAGSPAAGNHRAIGVPSERSNYVAIILNHTARTSRALG